jgi:hypothetical protein
MAEYEEKCCICFEEVREPYVFIKHLQAGKSRIYTGHKRCLFKAEYQISNGYGFHLKYTEIDTPRMDYEKDEEG